MKKIAFYLTVIAACMVCDGFAQGVKTIEVRSSQFTPGANMDAKGNDDTQLHFVLQDRGQVPFSQSAVIQSTEQAKQGPAAEVPFFTVRFALPIPAAYTHGETAELVGIDEGVFVHAHSPGFEVMDNGDAYAVYFSAPFGKSEADISTTFYQARLRYGSDDWDMPELFFNTIGCNDQSGLLWNDNGRIWFFGGGRNISDYVPFREAYSDDFGQHWTFSIPKLNEPATDYTAQPISNAFRDPRGNMYFTMDADGSQSFLWRSTDNGVTWNDMKGRTGGRHSTIVPLDDKGNLLSIGGKNASVNGWNPQNLSHDWGATWEESTASPFPPLATAQRPCVIRLKSGNLLLVSDAYIHKYKKAPAAAWKNGNNCFVAISKDNGQTWRIKTFPVGLPHQNPTRKEFTSLGYTTVRQAPNGTIHVLTSANYPGIHYEFNEAWVWSDEGDITPETEGGVIRKYSENYPGGQLKSKWTARICPNGRYLLHGKVTDYYENGKKQHEATYVNGRKSGTETFWNEDGSKRWIWKRDLKKQVGTWTQYWPNGKKKVTSTWDIKPVPRDLNRPFNGNVANGPATHYDEQGKVTATYMFVNGIKQK